MVVSLDINTYDMESSGSQKTLLDIYLSLKGIEVRWVINDPNVSI